MGGPEYTQIMKVPTQAKNYKGIGFFNFPYYRKKNVIAMLGAFSNDLIFTFLDVTPDGEENLHNPYGEKINFHSLGSLGVKSVADSTANYYYSESGFMCNSQTMTIFHGW
jgi:hypothetical protein